MQQIAFASAMLFFFLLNVLHWCVHLLHHSLYIKSRYHWIHHQRIKKKIWSREVNEKLFFTRTPVPSGMWSDAYWSWFPGTVDIQAICLALPRGKRNFTVGFIRPRPIVARRLFPRWFDEPSKGVPPSSGTSMSSWCHVLPNSRKKTHFLTHIDFFDDHRIYSREERCVTHKTDNK